MFEKENQLCYTLGGIHRSIQLVEMLAPYSVFFEVHLNDLPTKTPLQAMITMYRYDDNGKLQKLPPLATDWINDPSTSNELHKRKVFLVRHFLAWLERTINHGVYVPENIYFSTMDQIKALRKIRPTIKKTSD